MIKGPFTHLVLRFWKDGGALLLNVQNWNGAGKEIQIIRIIIIVFHYTTFTPYRKDFSLVYLTEQERGKKWL